MPSYSLQTIAPPTISLQFHTFRFRVCRHETGEAGPWLNAVGEVTFRKPPQETWAEAGTRFRTAVAHWIRTYEQAQLIDTTVAAWLETQTWDT